jgi:hypothetical protein
LPCDEMAGDDEEHVDADVPSWKKKELWHGKAEPELRLARARKLLRLDRGLAALYCIFNDRKSEWVIGMA